VEAHRLHARVSAAETTAAVLTADGQDAGQAPFPMRLFHLSIVYLTLVFVVVAVCALLPVRHW
jgi:heme O synthase-like polyprenyltransferase